jgi:hypothetical protein
MYGFAWYLLTWLYYLVYTTYMLIYLHGFTTWYTLRGYIDHVKPLWHTLTWFYMEFTYYGKPL